MIYYNNNLTRPVLSSQQASRHYHESRGFIKKREEPTRMWGILTLRRVASPVQRCLSDIILELSAKMG